LQSYFLYAKWGTVGGRKANFYIYKEIGTMQTMQKIMSVGFEPLYDDLFRAAIGRAKGFEAHNEDLSLEAIKRDPESFYSAIERLSESEERPSIAIVSACCPNIFDVVDLLEKQKCTICIVYDQSSLRGLFNIESLKEKKIITQIPGIHVSAQLKISAILGMIVRYQEKNAQAPVLDECLQSDPNLSPDNPLLSLSPRALEVLECKLIGLRTGQIAKKFDISPKTVETHLRNIKSKLGGQQIEAILPRAFWFGLRIPDPAPETLVR
jgi:DNA-binding CsgD family transcriptional regulator